MNRNKPRIGITGPAKGGAAAWMFTSLAIRFQGGKPVRINPQRRLNQPIDGLILGGGADISPERYGALLEDSQSDIPKAKSLFRQLIRIFSLLFYPFIFLIRNILSSKSDAMDPARDELELDLLDRAVGDQMPVLGICRGAQLINVKFGGSLHQNLSGFYTEVPEVHTIWPRKEVQLQSGSKLQYILGASGVIVNALHNQAVDTLGEGIMISAKESSGIIQAIEHKKYPFLIGVQWHPEYMPQISHQRALFEKLVKEAVKNSPKKQA